MRHLFQAIDFIRAAKNADPSADKGKLQKLCVEHFGMARVRSVCVGDGYSLRFSQARPGTFSNTVLSLSALKIYDDKPFVVVVVRTNSVSFLLANTTLLRKISHSSRMLRVDNVRGSFNGTDIVSNYGGVANIPENFEELFAEHKAFTWEENLVRLVEATNAIVGRSTRFIPTEGQLAVLLKAPERSANALRSQEFRKIENDLKRQVVQKKREILQAAQIDNVNLRGNAIERILTESTNQHELGDLQVNLTDGPLLIDIKTKLVDRASAPKAYNIDKMLTFLATPGSVFALLLVRVNIAASSVTATLSPVLEESVLSATRIQHHWAGRASRGVTQLSGVLPSDGAARHVDLARAGAFINELLDL
jgi:hypothetical protein